MDQSVTEVLHSFQIEGTLLSIAPHKNGHINDTFISTWRKSDAEKHYIHQRINHQVFTDVDRLMQNISAITSHIASRITSGSGERTLELIMTKSRELYATDSRGNYWRSYHCIPDTISYDISPSPEIARRAAAAFAGFQEHLLDLNPDDFPPSIPGFQDISSRFTALDAAMQKDAAGRLKQLGAEIDFALQRREHPEVLKRAIDDGSVPLRVVHGDLKINNVLFSKQTGEAVCVIDLDTTMPGTIIYDFGDFVRSAGVTSAEDEADLSKVGLNFDIFESLASGYVGTLVPRLSPGELELLPCGPALLSLSLGVRFLTDYLNGDTYFKVKDPEHNLRRIRAQFQLRRSFETHTDRMRSTLSLIAKHCHNTPLRASIPA